MGVSWGSIKRKEGSWRTNLGRRACRSCRGNLGRSLDNDQPTSCGPSSAGCRFSGRPKRNRGDRARTGWSGVQCGGTPGTCVRGAWQGRRSEPTRCETRRGVSGGARWMGDATYAGMFCWGPFIIVIGEMGKRRVRRRSGGAQARSGSGDGERKGRRLVVIYHWERRGLS